MASISAIVQENQSKSRQLERIKDAQETREDYATAVVAAAGSRIGLKIATAFVPAIAPLVPVIEIGGGLYFIKRAFDLDDTSARDLGLGIGLGIGAADRLADFALTAINKFKTK